jgi:hypothetical protein
LLPEINDDPLGVLAVGITSEMPVKVRIAFPKRVRISIVETRVTVIVSLVYRAAAPWKVVTIREQYRLV